MSTALPDHVYSVLIGIENDTVVLPNSAIAEVAGQETLQRRAGDPPWWLGTMEWRGRKLPVIALEALLGRAMPEAHRRCRLVIVNTISDALDSAQYAIFSQSYPLLVTLNETAIQPAAFGEQDPEQFVLSRVEFANRPALIPALGAIETELQTAITTAGV